MLRSGPTAAMRGPVTATAREASTRRSPSIVTTEPLVISRSQAMRPARPAAIRSDRGAAGMLSPRRLDRSMPIPADGIVEPVVAPEELALDGETPPAQNPQLARAARLWRAGPPLSPSTLGS